jgi:hypothetical protein
LETKTKGCIGPQTFPEDSNRHANQAGVDSSTVVMLTISEVWSQNTWAKTIGPRVEGLHSLGLIFRGQSDSLEYLRTMLGVKTSTRGQGFVLFRYIRLSQGSGVSQTLLRQTNRANEMT